MHFIDSLRTRLTLTVATVALTASSTFARQTPVELIVDRMYASVSAALQYNETASQRMLVASEPALAPNTVIHAARAAIAQRFQEPWGPGMDVWWTWRYAGTAQPFVPFVYSTTLANRSMQDLLLLPHEHDTQSFATLPEEFQAFLYSVPPSAVSTFVYSARFDSDLVNVGYAASGVVNGVELLCFAPIYVVPSASSVSAPQLATALWLPVMHGIVGDIGLYPDFVHWIVGDVDTSMDGPLGPIPETQSPCNGDALLACMNQAWAAFVAAKAALAAGMRAELAAEAIRHNQAINDSWNNYDAAREHAAFVTGLGRLNGEPPSSYSDLLDVLYDSAELQRAQLDAAHRQIVNGIRQRYCALIRNAMDNAIAQVKACFHIHCPDLEAAASAALDAARVDLIASVGGCL